jgi:hypothetical protein
LHGDDPPSGFLPAAIITQLGVLGGGPSHYRHPTKNPERQGLKLRHIINPDTPLSVDHGPAEPVPKIQSGLLLWGILSLAQSVKLLLHISLGVLGAG